MLENPRTWPHRHRVGATRTSGHRPLEWRRPTRFGTNAGYWYIDKHVVFEYDQRETVGPPLLDYVSREAQNNGVERLRLYVGHMNES